jgi:uncharacterized protein YdeI (YjbR/CyaY-like superfamily)
VKAGERGPGATPINHNDLISNLNDSSVVQVTSDSEFDAWLRAHGESEQEVFVAIFKKSSGKQTVTVSDLQETALCHGWIDSRGVRIDDERWAIRFTPRRPGSNWSDKNRNSARRLLAERRMTPEGRAVLPEDL